MPTTPPTITAAPTPPQRGVKATFSALLDAFVTWLVAAVSQFGAVAANVYANAVETASNAATASTAATTATDAAAAAVATANATLWVSGATVQQRANVISPLDHQTYRRITATGVSNTDPKIDTTNYVLLSLGANGMQLLGTATVGSAVANIDFLSSFVSTFSKFVIQIDGCAPSANDALQIRFAVAGVIDTASNYREINGNSTSTSANSNTATAVGNLVAGQGATAVIEFCNALDTTGPKVAMVDSITSNGASPASVAYTNKGLAYFGGKPSGFRLYWSGGSTFTAGTVRVYGVRAA